MHEKYEMLAKNPYKTIKNRLIAKIIYNRILSNLFRLKKQNRFHNSLICAHRRNKIILLNFYLFACKYIHQTFLYHNYML